MKTTLTALMARISTFFAAPVYEDTAENADEAALMKMLLG